MPQGGEVGGQVAVYYYYVGVVPAPETPLRPAEPDRRSCAAGPSAAASASPMCSEFSSSKTRSSCTADRCGS
jgi:hypothetical protein